MRFCLPSSRSSWIKPVVEALFCENNPPLAVLTRTEPRSKISWGFFNFPNFTKVPNSLITFGIIPIGRKIVSYPESILKIHVQKFPLRYIQRYNSLIPMIHLDIHLISVGHNAHQYFSLTNHIIIYDDFPFTTSSMIKTGTLSKFWPTHCTYHIQSSNTGHLISHH